MSIPLPIVAKLRALEDGSPDFIGDPEGSCVTVSARNPDGFEAAEIIEELYEALILARKIAAAHGIEPDVIDKALAKARGEQ